MFETAIRQLRMALSMVWGRPINPRNIENLIDDALKTLAEFGSPGDDVEQLLDGPFSDPKARREFQNRAIQITTRRLKKSSPYYRDLFDKHAINPDTLTVDTFHQLPLTNKYMVQQQEAEFIATTSQPYVTTRTTGTTGQPTEIWLSRYETELWASLAALSGLLRNELTPTDSLQINISSRATAAVQQSITACRLVGAHVRMLGLIPPEESLAHLLGKQGEEAPTLLSIYPSYLAELVTLAQQQRLNPRDFRLRRIDAGGEILSDALSQAAKTTFGVPIVNDTFAMTEILPVSGRVCAQGHLHPDLNMGLVEVIDLTTGEPAKANMLGTLVVTPFYPYRECMPVLRYDTRDVVRQLPNDPLNCELAGIPATSRILGKANHLFTLSDQIVTMRDLVEVYEALPAHPWPARFHAHVDVAADHIDLLVPAHALGEVTLAEVERRYHRNGIPVRVSIDTDEDHDLPLRAVRADLREVTFAGRRD